MVLSRFSPGSLQVLTRFSPGSLQVLSRFSPGSLRDLLVLSSFFSGSLQVLSRFYPSSLQVLSRFSSGSDLSINQYIEISSNSDHFFHLIYLISLKPEGGASVNSFKFQLYNHLFVLRSFYKLIYRNIKQFWSFLKSHLSHIFETWGWCNCQFF